MARIDLLDEYTSIVQPSYGPARWEVDDAAARRASACLKAMVLLVFGGVLIVASLHSLASGEPESSFEVTADGRD